MTAKETNVQDRGKRLRVKCHGHCPSLDIYLPDKGDPLDESYEIGGVYAERKEWAKLFRRAGIL